MKLSAYDNSNSCKYENMLVAQNEITRYKKRHGIDIKSASEVEIDDKRTPDEVFNNMERSEEEKNHILQNYENYYINQLFDHIEDEVMIATAENMPTSFISKVYKSICRKMEFDNVIIFVNVQSTDKILLGCVSDELKKKIDNNVYVGDKKQLDDKNWLFYIKKEDLKMFSESCQEC